MNIPIQNLPQVLHNTPCSFINFLGLNTFFFFDQGAYWWGLPLWDKMGYLVEARTSVAFEHGFSGLPLSAASWHSAALPTSPPSAFRAAESASAVPEWGNICSLWLAGAQGGSCVSEVMLVQHTSPANVASPSAGAKARALLFPLTAAIRSIQRSKPHLLRSPRP